MSIQPIQPDESQKNASASTTTQEQTRTPEKQIINEHISPHRISPCPLSNENIISLKPPKSPTSSPSRAGKTSPKTGSCSKTLFTSSNTNEPPSIPSTKRSPTRTGIMSRLAKHSQNTKRNNLLLNALPTETTNNPNEIPQIHVQTYPAN